MNLLKTDVKKLYFTFLLSAFGSTLVTNIYSTVDMICMGQYAGPIGSAAVACTSPLWPLMLCFGFLAGMGGAVLMSNKRGAGEERAANEFFTLAIILSCIATVIISSTIIFFTEPLLILFGAKGEVLEASLVYSKPIAYISPTFTLCATVSCFVRNDGEAALPTIATVIGGLVNVLGDIFFVFDFGLGLGMFGAGLATSLGQAVSFLIIVSYFFWKKCKLKFTKISIPFKKLLLIFAVGNSAFITEIASVITSAVFNNIITERLSSDHLAVYGTAYAILITVYCFFYAVGSALQPISSANYGAGNIERTVKVRNLALIFSVFLGIFFFALIQLFPDLILPLYMDTTPEIMLIGPGILRAYNIHLFFVGLGIVTTYYLQSVLKKKEAFLISILRALILPVAFALLLPAVTSNDFALWWSLPLAELVATAVAMIFLFRPLATDEDE